MPKPPSFSSSPGVTELASAGLNAGTTAFQQMATGLIGGSIGENRWLDASNPWANFLYASDGEEKNRLFQNLFRGLVDEKAPAGTKYRNAWEYVQDTMRKIGLSSAKTTLGIPTAQDMNGLENVIRGAIGSNATDPISWLTAAAMGYSDGKTVKQLDTTPSFNRQVQKALQLKSWDDSKEALYDLYYSTWGEPPSDDLVGKFQTSWNAEMKKQTVPAVTEGKTSYEKVYDEKKPIYDKTKPILGKNGKPKKDKNGKIMYEQALDKDGNPKFEQLKNASGQYVYKTVYKSKTVSEAEGFTSGEQEQFLADFLSSNYPGATFNAEELGGAAKAIFDELVNAHKNNYSAVPGFDKISGTLLDMISNADPNVAAEILRNYKDDIRKEASRKYMSLAEDLAAGKDAKPIVQNLLTSVGNYLETTVYEDDSIMKTILNFKDEKGTYRLPNELELSQLLDNDPRAAVTSRKKNEAVDMFQVLRSRLNR